jgi:hypothetical protein
MRLKLRLDFQWWPRLCARVYAKTECREVNSKRLDGTILGGYGDKGRVKGMEHFTENTEKGGGHGEFGEGDEGCTSARTCKVAHPFGEKRVRHPERRRRTVRIVHPAHTCVAGTGNFGWDYIESLIDSRSERN